MTLLDHILRYGICVTLPNERGLFGDGDRDLYDFRLGQPRARQLSS
jgi:hypothetical protein